MIKYPYRPCAYVQCGNCGESIENTPEQNVALHADEGELYPNDAGFGQCIRCGGDPTVEVSDDEEQTRRALGWAKCMFFDARIPQLRAALSEGKRVKFDALPYWKKCRLVQELVLEGSMV